MSTVDDSEKYTRRSLYILLLARERRVHEEGTLSAGFVTEPNRVAQCNTESAHPDVWVLYNVVLFAFSEGGHILIFAISMRRYSESMRGPHLSFCIGKEQYLNAYRRVRHLVPGIIEASR